MNNIAYNLNNVNPPDPETATLLSLFKNAPKFTKTELHHSCPPHARKNKYINFISSGHLLNALIDTNLLGHLMRFLNSYSWTHRNFCCGLRSLEKKWHMNHRTIVKIYLCLFFMGIIERQGKWVFATHKGAGWAPVWVLTDKLFTMTPDTVYLWSKKFNFRCGLFQHK